MASVSGGMKRRRGVVGDFEQSESAQKGLVRNTI